MRKIIGYKLVSFDNPVAVEEAAKQLINEGWEPFGFMQTTKFFDSVHRRDSIQYSQAFVYYKKEHKSE